MNGRPLLFARARRLGRAILQVIALLALALPAVSIPLATETALADPATGPGSVTFGPGAITAGTVPDGTCYAKITAAGGGGASSPAAAGAGGVGGAAASITATFAVVPGQSYGGTVGAAGTVSTGGTGAAAGGNAGTSATSTHRGGGGGGSTAVTIAGTTLVTAGGGGGGGGAHSVSPAGNGGGGGFTGIAAGATVVGSTGSNGVDGAVTVGGGQGGQAAAAGTGGVNSGAAARNGSAGSGGAGGNGGADTNADTGGGGGGGATGGGGGASTTNQGGTVTGAGGGGGSSRVAATSPVAGSPAPTSVSGAAGTASPSTSGPGSAGSATIDWLPCRYDLALTKTVSSPSVNAGDQVTWTVTVTNGGPDPMTKGDTVDLTDTLPAGPNGTPTPAYKVTAFTDTAGTASGLGAGALTCSGVTVGSSMPASTTCSRAYSAAGAVGAPSGGLRGLDVNEKITITYEQIISNTAPCATITNTATVKDRPTQSGTTDITGDTVTDTVNTPLTVDCYDLAVTKTASPSPVLAGGTITWSITVTNSGPAAMTGPVDTTANPLVVTDAFPATGVGSPVQTGATGTAGPCTLSVSTITCTNGLASGASEVLTYTQSVNAGIADNTTISNTASVVDPKTGDTNDSSTGSTAARRAPTITLAKTVSSRANAADQFTVEIKNGASTVASATTSGAGVSATTGAQTLTAGTSYTLTDAMAAGSVSVLAQYTKSISCTNASVGTGTVLPSGAGASFAITPTYNDVITCTFTNGPTPPTLTLSKSVAGRVVAADQFTVAIKDGASTVASATTSGSGVSATTGSTGVTAATTYTLTDAMAAGSTSTISDYLNTISCTNGTAGTGTTLPSGSGTSFSITPAAGDAIACTITNTAKPHLTLVKSVAGRVVAADQFTVAIMDGASTVASATTSGAGVGATTGSTALTAATTYTLTDAVAAGPSSLGDYLSSISCANTAGGSPTTLPSGTGTSFSITPANADNITCTITNTAKPHLTLVKSVAGRANASDQFTVVIKDGASTVASATTSGAAVSATTGSTALTASTAYTLTDGMAAGSASVIGQYGSTIACTNTNGGSPTTLPSGTGTSFSVTPANGDNITCTFTNTAGTATLGLVKSASPSSGVSVGGTVTYTYAVTNTGSLPLTNVTVTDPMGGLSAVSCTPAQGSTLAAGATMSCTATYTVTQADVDAGSIVNTGTVTGKDPSNNTITKTAGATVTPAQSSSLTLTKSALPAANVVTGDIVTYSFSGKNTGTVTLHGVTVTDPMPGLSAIACSPATPATLAPNATIDCTATYTVTQTNTDAGSFSNTATIAGLTPANNPVSASGGTAVSTLRIGSVSLTKTATPDTNVVAGDVVAYTFSGTNTGTVTLHGVTVTDPMPGLSAIACSPATPATLAPGAGISCTATYTVTQADVDAGSFSNTATVAGLDPTNSPVTKTAGETVTTNRTPALSLTKTATPNSGVVAGTLVNYTFTGTNTGTVTLHNVAVTDPMGGLSAIACSPATPATLAPGAGITCTATYTVTQADVDAGSFSNTATIDGLDPTNAAATAPATATVTTLRTPGISVTKAASPSSGVVAGDVVTYTVGATNTGTVTLSGVTPSDPLPGVGPFTCTPSAPATLAPGAGISCTATYTVTQADVDAGSIVNTAAVDATAPTGPVSGTAGTTVTADQTGSLTLTKSVTPNAGVIAGDVVAYTFTASNTGTVTVHGVSVTDPLPGLSAIGCTPAAPATLAPGASTTCTANYTVTQADVDAGGLTNTATVTGLDPIGGPVTAGASATFAADQSATLALTKTAAPDTGVVAGDVVAYSFHGTNTGHVTLHGVTVTDPMSGLSAVGCSPSAPADLAPGASIDCTATYTVTQADVDAGTVTNTATLAGTDPSGNPVDTTGGATVTALRVPALGLTKSASPSAGVVAGDVVTYTFTATNSGTLTAYGVSVTDPMTGLSALACTPAAPATLAPGATMTCTATYTVTQADVDAGSFTNTATVAAIDPDGNPVTDSASATVTADRIPAATFTKTATPNAGVVAGDVVTYTLTGTNSGTVTLHDVTVADPMPGLSAIGCTPAAPATLAPTASISCTATYTLTQADVDAGSVTNTATLSGLDPTNAPLTRTASATVTADATSGLALTKTALPASNVIAGDVVVYSFSAQNTGATTLHGVTVTDPMPGLSALACSPGTPAALAPNATVDCTATYTVSQADVDAGSFTNTATVAGTAPSGDPVSQDATATVTANTTAGVSFTKVASPSSGVVAGDTVTYTLAATNTGLVSLHGVAVTDPMSGLSAIACAPAVPATLAPGAGISCTATYTVTQADVDAGSITNTATIAGTDPFGNPVTNSAGASVTTDTTASVQLAKTASPTSGLALGEVVTYTMTATNNGAVTLDDVTITDPMSGLSALACTPAAHSSLAPNATMTCTATYTVTQADVDTGSISNTATVDAVDPGSNPVNASDSRTVLVGQTEGLAVTKTASPDTGVRAGDVVTYSIDATNTGTVSLHGIGVTDPLPGLGPITCTPAAPATLAPGASVHCTADLTVTQADVDAGSIVNTATASGLDPVGNPVGDSDSTTVTADQLDTIALTKTASPDRDVTVGTVVTYTMTATNTGTVTLTDATIADPMPGLSPLACTPGEGTDLAPGASMTCTATYVVTAADVAAGTLANTATVSGSGAGGHASSNASTVVVPTDPAPDVDLAKKLGGVTGDTATWLITVTNHGAGPLAGPFHVTDALPDGLALESATGDGWSCSGATTVTCTHAGDLAPGGSTTITVVTRITGSGSITNTASMDVLGETVHADATYTPSGGFAFTGGEAARYGLIGLLLVLGGWFVVVTSRRREDDDAEEPAATS